MSINYTPLEEKSSIFKYYKINFPKHLTISKKKSLFEFNIPD